MHDPGSTSPPAARKSAGSRHSFPVKLALGLGVAIALDTATQLLWKSAVIDLADAPTLWQMAAAAFHQPLFLVVVVMMLGQFLNWMLVLEQSDLSFAHAITALSYVTVAVASVLWLGERVDTVQGLGIALILAGVWLVSRTGRVTAVPPPEQQT